jgi:hypothetical protein
VARDALVDDAAKAKTTEEGMARVGTDDEDGAGSNHVSELEENLV